MGKKGHFSYIKKFRFEGEPEGHGFKGSRLFHKGMVQ